MKATVFLALLFILAASAPAATRRVPDEYLNIQAAIDACTHGDTVIVAPDTYTGQGNREINFGGNVITVRSENGPQNCIIDCEHAGPGFTFQNRERAGSVLEGFTITNGSWGGIRFRSGSNPTIKNCRIIANKGEFGGGINCNSSHPTIINCTITDNSSQYGGGGISCRDSSPLLMNCAIIGNEAYFSVSGGISCGRRKAEES